MKVLLVSGGSGGHLVPAMAVAEYLQPRDRCVLMSTRRPVDRIFSSDGNSAFEWETIGLQKFTPLWKWLSPPFLMQQFRAVRQIGQVFDKTRPDVVVGFGGYLSAVGVVTAWLRGVPTVIHEQNFVPGRANRFLASIAGSIAVSFPETDRFLSQKSKVEMTGNPLRIKPGSASTKEAREAFGFDLERPVLLVMGGSQGSRSVNRLALKIWQAASPQEKNAVQVLHLAGPYAGEVEQGYQRLGGMKAVVIPFLRRMDLALASANVAISRAGATAIAEMAVMGVPSVLIPYPYAAAHQRANAQWVEKIGGAVLLEEEGLSAEKLRGELQLLLKDPKRLSDMKHALREHADGEAAERMGELVRRVAKRRKSG